MTQTDTQRRIGHFGEGGTGPSHLSSSCQQDACRNVGLSQVGLGARWCLLRPGAGEVVAHRTLGGQFSVASTAAGAASRQQLAEFRSTELSRGRCTTERRPEQFDLVR